MNHFNKNTNPPLSPKSVVAVIMMRCRLWRVELGLELNCAFAHGKFYIMIRYCLGKNSLSKALFHCLTP